MRTAPFRLATAAAVALAGAAVLVPAAPAAPHLPPLPTPPDVEEKPAPPSVFAGTAIGTVLEANGNEVPKSGAEMMRALATLGEFAQLPVTFSAVDVSSGLAKPRVVITPKPSLTAPLAAVVKPQAGADLLVLPDPVGPAPALPALGTGELTRPSLEGRLFLAANMDRVNGNLKVKTFEFISWNSRRQRFDFGFIECHEKEAEIRVVDGVKCFSCHKNRGPILGQGPWSNSTHNDVVREAVARVLGDGAEMTCGAPNPLGQPHRLDAGFDRAIVRRPNYTADGVAVFVPQGPAVDAGVRLGADLARDRDIYRYMLGTADGRRTFALLLGLIAAPGDLKTNNEAAKAQINREFAGSYAQFAGRLQAIRKAAPDALLDSGPAGSQGSLQRSAGGGGSWGGGSTLDGEMRVVWSGNPGLIAQLDGRRSRGEPVAVPSNRQPSNPKAFVPPEQKPPAHPAGAVSAMAVARLIGLTEGDRTFFANQLQEASVRFNRKTPPALLAKEVFAAAPFAELLDAGVIPDREDFKDRFAAALNGLLTARGLKALPIARRDYASGPNAATFVGRDDRDAVAVPTTACMRCHDVPAAGAKPAFSPIPLLAFDPFDAAARGAWLTATPAKDRAAVLARLAKRLFEDGDMPPEDSAEYGRFRQKDPDAFAALKKWVDEELDRAK